MNQDPRKHRPLAPDDFKFPPWVINLTFSGSHGKSSMFDTSDGIDPIIESIFHDYSQLIQLGAVTEHVPSGWEDEADYSEDDPRYWRVDCEDKTMPLVEYLDIVKKMFLNLLWVPHVQKVGSWPWIFEWNGAPGHEDEDEETKVGHLLSKT